MIARNTYRFLATTRNVMLGPYTDDEIGAWLRGVKTMREVHHTPEPIVVRARTRLEAQRILDGGGINGGLSVLGGT